MRTFVALPLILAVACGGASSSPSRARRPLALTPTEPAAPTTPEDLHHVIITAAPVGQGDAIVVDFGYRTPAHEQLCRIDWLIDGGPSGPRALHVMRAAIGCEVDALVLTHPHGDHFEGATAILAARVDRRPNVLALYGSGETRGPPRDRELPSTWADFTAAAADAQLDFVPLHEGQILSPAPGRTVRVLWSGGHFPDTPAGADINNDSLVLMIEYAGWRVLFTGDIETEAQDQLVARYCTPAELAGDGRCEALRADVLKVPHHGSDHFSPRFFAAVHPTIAIVSAGHANLQYHHPRAEPLELLRQLGAHVYSTSGGQPVTMTLNPGPVRVIQSSGDVDGQVYAWRDEPGGWQLLPLGSP